MRAEERESGLRLRQLPKGGFLAPWAAAVGVWLERRRTRRHLTRLSDHMLRDIGISQADVAHEVEKPFWRK